MYYFFSSGMASYTSSVFIGNLKILLFSFIVTPFSLFAVFGSIIFYVANHLIASTWSATFDVYATFDSHWAHPNFYVVFFVAMVLTVLVDLGISRHI